MRKQTSQYSVLHSHTISKVLHRVFSHHVSEPGSWGEGVYLEGSKGGFRSHQGEENLQLGPPTSWATGFHYLAITYK